MTEIRMIRKNELWQELKPGLVNFILFGGTRLDCVDEVLAAYEGDTFTGAVTLSPTGELRTGEPSIVGLLTLKEWRRKGIGTRLMEAAIVRMRYRGLIPIHIDVLSKNAKYLVERLDDEFRKYLIINDQSEFADCFDSMENAVGMLI